MSAAEGRVAKRSGQLAAVKKRKADAAKDNAALMTERELRIKTKVPYVVLSLYFQYGKKPKCI